MWGLNFPANVEVLGVTPSSTSLVQPNLTAINTKSAWAEITSSLPADICGMYVLLGSLTGAGNRLYDVGIGAASSEIVVVPNLFWAANPSSFAFPYYIPINLPAGVRIAVRGQADDISPLSDLAILPIYKNAYNDSGLQRFKDYGTNTSTSLGTAVTGGSSAWGSWTQIDASCANPIKALTVCAQSTNTGGVGAIQVGVGASSSEVSVLETICKKGNFGGNMNNIYPFQVDIPAGTRLSVRAYDTSPSVILIGGD